MGWLERLVGSGLHARREGQPARQVKCPNFKLCGSVDVAMIGHTHLVWQDGIEVRTESYGLRCVCLKCATVFAVTPHEVYEISEARHVGPALASAPDVQPAPEGPRPSLLGDMNRRRMIRAG